MERLQKNNYHTIGGIASVNHIAFAWPDLASGVNP
jgi:hypothetical protein